MSFVNKIKDQIGGISLKSQMKLLRRTPQVFNLDDCKTIGILFDAGNNNDFELLKKYVLYLRELKKKVKVMGFFNLKETPQVAYSKLEYDFFSQKELNWQNKPSSALVDNFIDESFDVLIDLNIYNHFPLRYIAAISKAKFKIGQYSNENKQICDLLIEMEADKDFKYFLRQVDTYLQMINKPSAQP